MTGIHQVTASGESGLPDSFPAHCNVHHRPVVLRWLLR